METGGDLLWVAERAPGHWIAAVGDVSGKGLAAAIYMSQSMALLDYAARKPDAALESISKRMDQALRNLMSAKDFLTICLIEWHEDGKFRVVRAGHPPPIYLANSGPIHIAPPGLALGMRPASPIDWHAYEGTLQPGEWIAIFSDGLTESMNQNGELYGTDRITEQLLRFRGTGAPKAACEAIFQQVALFEAQNKDDRTLFILARQ
jgi:serine phosphatase RsbU (regulator of sigma subunit)